jgi:tRNA threonylcarbamoyladenosine biosynthesis protein TsaB
LKTLAIDTSRAAGSVAALEGSRIAERTLCVAGEHARLLAPGLVEVAARLGWAPRDAELVAVVRGPGSFTGLRVGVATAKALAWAAGARLVGVSGFEVSAECLAEHAGRVDRPVAVAFDAGRGEVYAAIATPSATAASGWTVGPAGLCSLAAWVAAVPPGAWAAGGALEAAAALLADARPDVALPPPAAREPSAAAAGRVAVRLAAAGVADDPATLVPDYLRPSYADEKPAR